VKHTATMLLAPLLRASSAIAGITLLTSIERMAIGFGSSGDTAGLGGNVSFIAIPAPGTAVLLLAAAAPVPTRRRRV